MDTHCPELAGWWCLIRLPTNCVIQPGRLAHCVPTMRKQSHSSPSPSYRNDFLSPRALLCFLDKKRTSPFPLGPHNSHQEASSACVIDKPSFRTGAGLDVTWPCMEHGATRAGTWQQQPYLPTCPEWPAPGTRPSFQDCSSWGPMLRHGVKLQPATLVFHIGTCLSSCKAAEVGPSARAPCTHMETWMKLLKELCV